MTLKEFLERCSPEDFVGIWNIERGGAAKYKSRMKFEERPNQQQYFKIKNIPYGRIMYLLDKDIYVINHTEKGYLVRIGDTKRVSDSLDRHYLAGEIVNRLINAYEAGRFAR